MAATPDKGRNHACHLLDGERAKHLSTTCAFRNVPANLAAAGGLPIDRVDFKILKILRRDARTPFVEVARQVGMTEGAIRARVKRMTDDGTIERFTVVSRAAGMRALVAIRTRPSGSTSKVGRAVRKVGGVTGVLEVTGEQDLFALVDVADTAALNRAIEQIRKVHDVVETKSMTVLNEH